MTETELLERLRPAAFGIAYRMLGSVAEAEDVVQEGLLRLHGALEAGERIDSPRAYLSTVVTRLSIDTLRSARVRRETYVGEWLPEPLLTTDADDPARHAETADSLSFAFLALLERLSPEQRAVFLLHDVFDYPFEQVAEIVRKSPANVRQLAVRARRHVEEGRPRFDASQEQRERLADSFFAAAGTGDLEALEELLAEDVVLHGDGGGKVPAIARALSGRNRVARTLAAWSRFARRFDGLTVERTEVNGQPGEVFLDGDGAVLAVWTVDIADGRVQSVSSVVNPEKLGHLGEVGDMNRLLRSGR